MSAPLKFLNGLLLRTPLLSYADDDGALPGTLHADHPLRLALYLASKEFYRVMAEKQFDLTLLSEKELFTLKKYHNRMSTRPTPFGLFASFSAANWAEQGPVVLAGEGESLLHLLPDQAFAVALAGMPGGDPAAQLYRLNPTLYRAGEELRFIKSFPKQSDGRYQFLLESVDADALNRKLRSWLGGSNRTGAEITAFIGGLSGCPPAECQSYFDFLLDAQVIRLSDGLNIAGPDYCKRSHPALAELFGPSRQVGACVKKIEEITNAAQALKSAIPGAGRFGKQAAFYANSEKPVISGGLPACYQEDLLAALGAMTRLSRPVASPLLEQFKKEFTQRFESRKVPLMLALDPETGVGYGDLAAQAGADDALKDIPFEAGTKEECSLSWTAAHRLLFRKWNALDDRENVIRLEQGDLAGFAVNPLPLAPGMAVMFRLVNDMIQLESAGGATAASLIGRFTLFSEEIHQMALNAAAAEMQANTDVIFADIVQLSDLHTDNINRRASIFPYEITINANSQVDRDRQIPVSDLLLSLGAGGLVLESRTLRKRVVPRLCTAYNFRHNHLAVFRFLCDLQYQGIHADLSFDLEAYFPQLEHYPRVQFDRVILSPARWHLQEIIGKEPVETLIRRLKLPRYISLARFDQQLLFDLENDYGRHFFGECLSSMKSCTIQEAFLPDREAPLVQTTSGKPLVHQWVALLNNSEKVYEPLLRQQSPAVNRKRSFIPGSEWLYIKVYCAPFTSDSLLTGRILPVLEQLKKHSGMKWFFIRYSDPGYHIRLRIRTQKIHTGKALELLRKQFSGLVSDQIVREYQADVYRRELERYGADIIDEVESFFQASSEMAVHFLNAGAVGDIETDQFTISCYLQILDTLVPGEEERMIFLERNCDAFQREFGDEKALRVSLDGLYRSRRGAIFSRDWSPQLCLAIVPAVTGAFFKAALEKLAARCDKFSRERRHRLAADLVHMHVNRVYRNRQRQQEYILYYFIYKYTLSARAIARNPGRERISIS